MFAHDIAAADGGKTDGGRVTLARDAVALVDCAILEVAPQRLGHDLAHFQRRARGRIDLVAVVRLDDLNVVARGQRLGRHLQQLQRDVDANAHVGRHDDGRLGSKGGNFSFLQVAEAGGAHHGLDAQFGADLQVCQRAFRPGEVDQDIGIFQAGAQVAGDGHTTGHTQKGGGIGADAGAGGHVEGTGQCAMVAGTDGLDQHAAHAARGPRHCHTAGSRRGR